MPDCVFLQKESSQLVCKMSDSEDDEGSKDRHLKVTLIGDGTAGKVITLVDIFTRAILNFLLQFFLL